MNIELIKKYKKEFDHWLNGGKLLFKWNRESKWMSINTNHEWRWSSNIYIINDEYVEFRKALAEGKVVEFSTSRHLKDIWHTLETPIFNEDYKYRIKPDEPKFKVGDWVVRLRNNRVMQFHLSCEQDSFELWKPKVGEWCWFWNKLSNHMQDIPQLLQFKSIDNHVRPYLTSPNGRFGYCEPFIGTLPQELQ